MGKILARGHSRVPVYSGNPKNIIGLLLVGFAIIFREKTSSFEILGVFFFIFLISYYACVESGEKSFNSTA